MRLRIFRIIVAVGAFAATAWAEDYRSEAERIAGEIVEIHPRGAEIARNADFIAAREALVGMAGETDLAHYAMALGRLFHTVGDGHTAAIPVLGEAPEFSRRYPLELERFTDGLWVVAAAAEAEPLLGARLIRIGGRPVEEIVRAFVEVQAGGSPAWAVRWAALGLTVPGFLVGLDVAPADLEAAVRFEAETPSGGEAAADLRSASTAAADRIGLPRRERPLQRLGGGATNFVAELADRRALVLVLGAMEDREEKSFESFTAEAAAALAETRAERLVIDLRDNGGGNNMLAEPLRRTLLKSRFNRPGGIYVLTSPRTFSAAMNFATRLERETDALFVGEPTGGSPNHFGDARFARAPDSGIPYIVSTLRWQDSTPFDERDWILPDLPAPPSFADHLAGRDVALEEALGHDPGPPPASDWRWRVAKPWDRSSQKVGWRFFFEEPPAP